jgi:hypothetical protein
MSWRGRGYGGPFHLGRLPQSQKPFILYPDDDIVLSDLPNILFEIDSKKQEVVQQKFLVRKEVRFTEFWKSSPYYLQENSVENDIEKAFQNERFSDRFRLKSSKKNRLSDCLELKKSNFTQELLVGMKRKGRKKVKWDFKKRGDRMFKNWEKNEAKSGDFEENDSGDEEEEDKKKKKKKKGEEESEEQDDEYDSDGDESPLSSDGDYGRGEYFDEDDGDYNPTGDDLREEGPIY